MPGTDLIARGLLSQDAVRVVVAITTETVREAARRHGAVGGAAVAVARAATAGMLLATLTKDEERVTLQILGDGPLGAIIADASSTGTLRAFVKNPSHSAATAVLPGTRVPLAGIVGRTGTVSLIRDLGLREHFKGQTAMVDGEIDTDVEQYLSVSEQIDSALACDAILDEDLDLRLSAGVLLQTLPDSGAAELLSATRERMRAGVLSHTLAQLDGPPTPEALARAVLGEAAMDINLLETRPVWFFCPCSRERAEGTLGLLGREDLASLVHDDGGATVVCQFCRSTYVFTKEQLATLNTKD